MTVFRIRLTVLLFGFAAAIICNSLTLYVATYIAALFIDEDTF